ncbi:MAG: hypothetical protein AVDCRST_MAG30-3329 [uncultured Solirubrobacteraceae bacterium]|uniref:Uncharacterized protein n=1 Tax=uncultured Solirubrobacteraceae bacterium TaxID=1162706 RepID=A0A6J4TLD1_9ACTN|nr:MAG: hypothetical protein AVDCRST_MAG30-3329 [uncultured Solirubrobacteraceae bacterium]
MRPRAIRLIDRVLLTSWRACKEFVEDRGHRDAAQIAFFAVFSFVPLALLLVATFGLVLDDGDVRRRVVDTAFEGIPLAEERDRRRLEQATNEALTGAGRLSPFSVILLIVGASGLMSALRHAINQAWDIAERPSLVRRKALDVALILGATSVLVVSLSSSGVRRAADLLDDEAGGGWLAAGALDAAGEVLPWAVLGLGILFLYRVLPMKRQPVREIWPGALVALLLLAIVKGGLEVYLESFSDFGALYGSLGALMALLLFVFAASNVIVFGAEFASEWSRLPDDVEVRRIVGDARGKVRRRRARAPSPAGPPR